MNSEDFLKLVEMRQSDRDYDRSRKVPEDAIRRIVDAGRLAPSACNSQPWHFVVVTRNDLLEQMSPILNQMNMNKFASSAPCFIVMVQEAPNFTARLGGWIKNRHFPLIDGGIAAAHITLAATAEGLGSCIMGWFDEKRLKKLLSIPSSKSVHLVISLGYSKQDHRQKQRHSIDEVMSFEKY